MKQYSCSIVSEVPKPSGVGFDELNGAIESFGTGVAYSVLAVVEQTGLMAPEHLDYSFDRLQTTTHGVAGPGIKEAFGRPHVVIAPELSERFFDTPCSAGLEVELIQRPERNRLGAAPISIGFEPRVLAARQRRRARLRQTAVFLFAHRIDRLPEVFGNVKPVMDDVGVWNDRLCRTNESRPHIHGYRFDRGALSRAECFQQALGRFQFSLRHQIKHSRAVDVGQYADVGVPSFGTLFVNSKMGYGFLTATQHASFHSAHHNAVDGAPSQSRELANPFGGGAYLQQLDHKCFHQKGDPAVAFGPWHGQFFNCAVAIFELGYARLDDRLKLAGIQMPPLTFGPAVDVSSLRIIRRIRPYLAVLEFNLNDNPLLFKGKINSLYRPRRLQSKKSFVQGGVFHDVVSVFEKQNSLLLTRKSQCN